ncbi:hypothetical protein B0H14DRAFT_2562525 [Mycena olivaceomarginata]|nr:hypothetical protein B0H14DRAFT_2562525 [Mycena olivaceomarginata]
MACSELLSLTESDNEHMNVDPLSDPLLPKKHKPKPTPLASEKQRKTGQHLKAAKVPNPASQCPRSSPALKHPTAVKVSSSKSVPKPPCHDLSDYGSYKRAGTHFTLSQARQDLASGGGKPFDKTTLEEMLGTQRHENGIPLHCLSSAQDLDPTIRSGAHQSAVAVATKLQFEALPEKIQHNIHRHRSVLILDIGAEATPPAFDRALWRGTTMLMQIVKFKDLMSCKIPASEQQKTRTLSSWGGHAILNGLQNLLLYSNIATPMEWLCVVKDGDFSSRRSLHGFGSRKSNIGFLQWEFILLGPNMTFYMCAGTIHFVISLNNYNATTNTDHATPLHIPDLGQRAHVFDLINLICFVILFPTLDSASYEHLENGMLPMQRDCFAELMYAWDLTLELAAVTHMAAVLSRYMKDWQNKVERVARVHTCTIQQATGAGPRSSQIQTTNTEH